MLKQVQHDIGAKLYYGVCKNKGQKHEHTLARSRKRLAKRIYGR